MLARSGANMNDTPVGGSIYHFNLMCLKHRKGLANSEKPFVHVNRQEFKSSLGKYIQIQVYLA